MKKKREEDLVDSGVELEEPHLLARSSAPHGDAAKVRHPSAVRGLAPGAGGWCLWGLGGESHAKERRGDLAGEGV